MRPRFPLVLGILVALLIAILDQASKWAVLEVLRAPGAPFPPPFAGPMRLAPFLDFTLVWNRGISFGVANQQGYPTVWFALVALAITVALLLWLARTPRRYLGVALGLVIGGAIGNLIDRLRFGAVVDFVYVHIGAFDWWPSFNVADSAISVGAALLVIDSLFAGRDSPRFGA